MPIKTVHSILLIFSLLFALSIGGCENQTEKEGFSLIEATISDIHAAYRLGELNCRQLVEAYLERIQKYDQRTQLNSIVVINPHALERADELDMEFRRTGILRPLHGIPLIVKDNYETKDMQTTAGSEALKDFFPPDDAYQVRKLCKAGAIILAKSNMAEWAFSPYQTQSSIAGITRNPYDLKRVPAGSSGASSHCCLVGIRSTMGLTSRDGIIPLYSRNDVGGPMSRTLEDAVKILEVIAGYDPADPITEVCKGKVPENYTQFLDEDGLQGAKIGVFRFFTDLPQVDSQVMELFDKALEVMKIKGARIVDPFVIHNFGSLIKNLL